MNERFEELAQECVIMGEKEFAGKPVGFNYKKFAELIVRECMEQINKVEGKGDAHLGGGYFYDGTRLCRDAIKQHFGLEQ